MSSSPTDSQSYSSVQKQNVQSTGSADASQPIPASNPTSSQSQSYSASKQEQENELSSFYSIKNEELKKRLVPKTLKEALQLGKQIGFNNLADMFYGSDAEKYARKAFTNYERGLQSGGYTDDASLERYISKYEDEYQAAVNFHVGKHKEKAGERQYYALLNLQNAQELEKQAKQFETSDPEKYKSLMEQVASKKKEGVDRLRDATDWTKFVYYYEKGADSRDLANIDRELNNIQSNIKRNESILADPATALFQSGNSNLRQWEKKASDMMKREGAARTPEAVRQRAIQLYEQNARNDLQRAQNDLSSYQQQKIFHSDLSQFELEGNEEVVVQKGLSKEETDAEIKQRFQELVGTVKPTKYNVDFNQTEQVRVDKGDSIFTYTFSKPVLDILRQEVRDEGESDEIVNQQAIDLFQSKYGSDVKNVPVNVKVLEADYARPEGRQDALEFVRDDSGAITGYKYIPDPTRPYFSETKYKVPKRVLEAIKKQEGIQDDVQAVELLETKYPNGVPVDYDLGFKLVMDDSLQTYLNKLQRDSNRANRDMSNLGAILDFKDKFGVDPKSVIVKDSSGKERKLTQTGVSFDSASNWFTEYQNYKLQEDKKQAQSVSAQSLSDDLAAIGSVETTKQQPVMIGSLSIEEARKQFEAAANPQIQEEKKQQINTNYAIMKGVSEIVGDASGQGSAYQLSDYDKKLLDNAVTNEIDSGTGKNKTVSKALDDFKQEMNDYYNKPVLGSQTEAQIDRSMQAANDKDYQKALKDSQTAGYAVFKEINNAALAGTGSNSAYITSEQEKALIPKDVSDSINQFAKDAEKQNKALAAAGYDVTPVVGSNEVSFEKSLKPGQDLAVPVPTKIPGIYEARDSQGGYSNVDLIHSVTAPDARFPMDKKTEKIPYGPQEWEAYSENQRKEMEKFAADNGGLVGDVQKKTDNPFLDFAEGVVAPFQNLATTGENLVTGSKKQTKSEVEGDLMNLGIEAVKDLVVEGKTDVGYDDLEKVGKNILDNPAYAAGNILASAASYLVGIGEAKAAAKFGIKAAGKVGEAIKLSERIDGAASLAKSNIPDSILSLGSRIDEAVMSPAKNFMGKTGGKIDNLILPYTKAGKSLGLVEDYLKVKNPQLSNEAIAAALNYKKVKGGIEFDISSNIIENVDSFTTKIVEGRPTKVPIKVEETVEVNSDFLTGVITRKGGKVYTVPKELKSDAITKMLGDQFEVPVHIRGEGASITADIQKSLGGKLSDILPEFRFSQDVSVMSKAIRPDEAFQFGVKNDELAQALKGSVVSGAVKEDYISDLARSVEKSNLDNGSAIDNSIKSITDGAIAGGVGKGKKSLDQMISDMISNPKADETMYFLETETAARKTTKMGSGYGFEEAFTPEIKYTKGNPIGEITGYKAEKFNVRSRAGDVDPLKGIMDEDYREVVSSVQRNFPDIEQRIPIFNQFEAVKNIYKGKTGRAPKGQIFGTAEMFSSSGFRDLVRDAQLDDLSKILNVGGRGKKVKPYKPFDFASPESVAKAVDDSMENIGDDLLTQGAKKSSSKSVDSAAQQDIRSAISQNITDSYTKDIAKYVDNAIGAGGFGAGKGASIYGSNRRGRKNNNYGLGGGAGLFGSFSGSLGLGGATGVERVKHHKRKKGEDDGSIYTNEDFEDSYSVADITRPGGLPASDVDSFLSSFIERRPKAKSGSKSDLDKMLDNYNVAEIGRSSDLGDLSGLIPKMDSEPRHGRKMKNDMFNIQGVGRRSSFRFDQSLDAEQLSGQRLDFMQGVKLKQRQMQAFRFDMPVPQMPRFDFTPRRVRGSFDYGFGLDANMFGEGGRTKRGQKKYYLPSLLGLTFGSKVEKSFEKEYGSLNDFDFDEDYMRQFG